MSSIFACAESASSNMNLILAILTVISAQRMFEENGNVVKEVIKAPFDTSPSKPAKRNAPAVQVINKCEYTEFYLELLREMNKIRYGNDDVFTLCMNIKLMWAAKIQSDFQALVDEPTHSGPRILKLGSVEERIDASRFIQRTGIVAPEEIIYYWPQFPEQAYGKERRKILAAALQDILKDPAAKATLTHPGYRFFGAAMTRKSDGKAFMTLVLADSREEQCHVCYRLSNGSLARKYEKRPNSPPNL